MLKGNDKMSASAAAKTSAEAKPLPRAEEVFKEIERDRIEEAQIACGSLMRLTLPGDETIEEGPQDILRFGAVGADMHTGGWLEVLNDSESFYGLFRIVQLLGTRSTGVRGLILQSIVPPRRFDRQFEAPQATGNWYCRYAGGFLKWIVVSPNGSIFRKHLMTENEGQHVVMAKMTGGRPL
jgi:hypothetical protein